jgi:hypothetical protein
MPKLLQYINRVKVTSVKVADLETKNNFENQLQYINNYYYKSIRIIYLCNAYKVLRLTIMLRYGSYWC